MPRHYWREKTVNKKLSENYQNAMDYLKRKRKSEFSERLEQTGADGKLTNSNNKCFTNKQQQHKKY